MTHLENTNKYGSARPWLGGLTLVLAALAAPGCYRATGAQRSSLTAQSIPSEGGDRVLGLKSAAGPGDLYLGNDYVQLTVDGTPFGEADTIAGAVSGGSVVDAGSVQLDLNYQRVSMPTDLLDRLTPVLNLDPEISLVFSEITPNNDGDVSSIQMVGKVHDPKGHLNVPLAADRTVPGLSVLHVIRLARQGHYFQLETTIRNQSGAAVPIRNIGDLVFQRGGGYRAMVPATATAGDARVHDWGVDIPAVVGLSDFSNPLANAVKAPMVVLMGAEPGAPSADCHGSLGLLPEDADSFLVASEAQPALSELRPAYAKRLVAGGLPVDGLAAGASLVHRRRLYSTSGMSVSSTYPNQGTGLVNILQAERFLLSKREYGTLYISAYGSIIRGGAYQAEIRFERYRGQEADPSHDSNDGNWVLERVEWLEPPEAYTSTNPVLGLLLPVGTYRIQVRSRRADLTGTINITSLVNYNNTDRPDLPGPITVSKDKEFIAGGDSYICPERDKLQVSGSGAALNSLLSSHAFVSRSVGGPDSDFQPMRLTLLGQGSAPDPVLQRNRRLGGYFDIVHKGKLLSGYLTGNYVFMAGNTAFGSAFNSALFVPLRKGNYVALASRGPLADLEAHVLSVEEGQTETSDVVIMRAPAMPAGWTSFDLPGSSLATTGGLHPAEILSSALAEGVEVVTRTEEDQHVDAKALYDDFRSEFLNESFTDAARTQVKAQPYVIGGRSSQLPLYGRATALFTPAPLPLRRGGARSSRGWTLADFLAQADGAFTVVHRPRRPASGPEDPGGLFTAQRFNRTQALGQDDNLWWNQTGSLAQGRTHGQFDALELVPGHVEDAQGNNLPLTLAPNATAWFTEYKELRADWFAILRQQGPAFFTKALGCSSAHYSLDTPVGLARTYLKATGFDQTNQKPLLDALKKGAAVASTGPLLEVAVGSGGPGDLVSLASAAAPLVVTVKVHAAAWVPVERVRLYWNGIPQGSDIVIGATDWTVDTATGQRTFQYTFNLANPGPDGFVVVEAGVPDDTQGLYQQGSRWFSLMKGIYPLAISNPVFVDADGNSTYTAPGLPTPHDVPGR